MHIRHVRMLVCQSLVAVPMSVWLAWRIVGRMLVLMMLVVHMLVLVLKRLMHMLMFVVFSHMQPHAHSHHRAGSRIA